MTVKEAVKRSGTPVALSGASVDAAEMLIQSGEKVRYAVVANCSPDGCSKSSGALVITTHRIIFCTCTLGKVTSYQLLLEDCVGLGDITGRMICKMKISGNNTFIIVELSRDYLTALQTAILEAVADYPNQSPIDFSPPTSALPSKIAPSPIKTNQTIKVCRSCGDRLLAEARKCPTCGSKDLAQLDWDDFGGIAEIRAYATKPQNKVATSAPLTLPASKRSQVKQRIRENKTAGVACCPKCGSTSLSANKKGFSAGKAAAGIFLTGGLAGAVAGGIGANRVEVICLNCGHKFKPGQ